MRGHVGPCSATGSWTIPGEDRFVSAGIIRPALLTLAATVAWGGATAATDPEKWLSEAEAAYARVSSYTAIFHKQQRVAGKLEPKETIFLKFRKPLSLYMKWIKPPYEGSELLYVAGWNQDRVRAHRGGLLRFVTRNLRPDDPGLMADNLRPVTSTGVGYLLESVARNIRVAIKGNELTFALQGEEAVYGRNTRVVVVTFPDGKTRDYDGRRMIIHQDLENGMLLRIRVHDRDDQLVESYGYEKLDLRSPLTDADFDPANPEYHF